MTIKITDQFILSTQGEKPLNKILANILNSIYFLNMPHQVQIRVYSSPGRTIRKKKYVQREDLFLHYGITLSSVFRMNLSSFGISCFSAVCDKDI